MPKEKPKKNRDTSKHSEVLKKMKQLSEEIRHHQKLYYVENKPIISDAKFDALMMKLKELEEEHPHLILIDTPTKSIGSDIAPSGRAESKDQKNESFKKEKHSIPVLSLKNTYNISELLDWANKVKENEKTLFQIQWKIDGATLVLYYEKGFLKKALTRGTGSIGDNVTANAITIKSIPEKIKKDINFCVRGEVFMYYKDFEEFNLRFDSIYANPRNLASGTLKSKNSRDVMERPLRWFGYDAYFESKKQNEEKGSPQQDLFLIEKKPPVEANSRATQIENDTKNLQFLKELGLPIVPDAFCVPFFELEKTVLKFEEKLKNITFPVDGLVIKIENLHLREELGFTSNAPKWAVAYKFKPEEAESTVLAITTFVGRTGRVTPRATLEAVSLSGSTVQHATLHNEEQIKRLDVRIGSKVKITKRGEIIPAIEEVVERGPNPPFVFPLHCPSCEAKLMKPKGFVDFLCPNKSCKGKILQSFIFFCGRKQMDIEGLGEKNCEFLFEQGYLLNIPDIYKLKKHASELEKIEGFGIKSIAHILNGIEASKKKDFSTLMISMGLNEIGPNTASLLIENGFDSFAKIKNYTSGQDFETKLKKIRETQGDSSLSQSKKEKQMLELFPEVFSIHGIGYGTALAFLEQFHQEEIRKIFEELGELGLHLSHKSNLLLINEKLKGQTWCVTGTFENFKPRELALNELKKRGAHISENVATRTTHLLAGANAGSKLEKAEKLKIKIVSEKEFMDML